MFMGMTSTARPDIKNKLGHIWSSYRKLKGCISLLYKVGIRLRKRPLQNPGSHFIWRDWFSPFENNGSQTSFLGLEHIWLQGSKARCLPVILQGW